MKLPEIHIDDIVSASRQWERAWRAHERKLREYNRAYLERINNALEAQAIRDLGRYPEPHEIADLGSCAIHTDGRREYKWRGKTVAVAYPWSGPTPPRVEIFVT